MSLWLLDPFGGGAETGHIGAYGKKESHIALEAALEAKKHLERNGEKTIITRKNDEYISDDKRTTIINDSGTEVLVIFRMNSSDDINIKGVKVAYVNRSDDMEYLAQLIKCEIQSELNTVDCGVINESNLYNDINSNAILKLWRILIVKNMVIWWLKLAWHIKIKFFLLVKEWCLKKCKKEPIEYV